MKYVFTLHLQFNVMASDGADPEKTATTVIYIRVQRDLRAPRFESLPYARTILETLDVGASVFTFRGRDDDKLVGTYCTSIM